MNISPFEAINSHIDKLKNTMNTSLACEVVSLEIQGDRIVSVAVKPFSDKFYKGDSSVFKRPIIYGVPLLYPSGDKGLFSFPVKVGDYVLVIFSQEDIDNFLEEKRGVPRTFRQFSYNDAIAIPCLHPHNSTVKPHKDNVELSYKDTVISIQPNNEIKIITPSNISTSCSTKNNECSSYDMNTRNLNINTNKVFIGNSRVDLVGVISDFIRIMSTAQTLTTGEPLTSAVELEALKELLEELK